VHPQRHLLYRAEPYELDLLLELHPETNRLMITGQLLDAAPRFFAEASGSHFGTSVRVSSRLERTNGANFWERSKVQAS
jgi:hypothetical protein